MPLTSKLKRKLDVSMMQKRAHQHDAVEEMPLDKVMEEADVDVVVVL
jgi:hypothetical protein